MPAAAGTYNLRFFRNDTPTKLATSATITVTAATPSVALSATTVVAGGTVTAAIANGRANASDWVTLNATAAVDGTYVDWKYLDGTHTKPAAAFPTRRSSDLMPAAAGTYNLRFFRNDTLIKLATSATITVTAATPSVALSATTVVAGGTVT